MATHANPPARTIADRGTSRLWVAASHTATPPTPAIRIPDAANSQPGGTAVASSFAREIRISRGGEAHDAGRR
jgi:hypothetical protein